VLRRDRDDEPVNLAALNTLELCANLLVYVRRMPARTDILSEALKAAP
jgi:hypothetical protein